MSGEIAFYFDFSSPYGYFAAQGIDELGARHGRDVLWMPIMLGPILKETGNAPLAGQAIKGDYCRHDWDRMARYLGVPWVLPNPFPIAALAPARAFYWLRDEDEDLAKAFAKRVFRAYFGEGRDISDAETVAGLAGETGVDKDALLTAVHDPEVKARLKEETEAARGKGVCGSPYFLVDGEGFWGADRMGMLEEWLRRGGW